MNQKSNISSQFRGVPAGIIKVLSDLLGHYPHQVISQQLVYRNDLSMSLFSFDDSEGISTDIQHQDILYIVQKGWAEVVIDNITHHLKQGECILVPGGCPHSINARTPLWILQISVGELPNNQNTDGGNTMQDYIKNIEKASVKGLLELVDYQADKVASLTLVQRPLFTTTVMAMDKGTGVGPHICEGDALVVALDGEGDIMIGDDHYTVKKDECIVMPAGIPHAVRGEISSFKMMLIVSKPGE